MRLNFELLPICVGIVGSRDFPRLDAEDHLAKDELDVMTSAALTWMISRGASDWLSNNCDFLEDLDVVAVGVSDVAFPFVQPGWPGKLSEDVDLVIRDVPNRFSYYVILSDGTEHLYRLEDYDEPLVFGEWA